MGGLCNHFPFKTSGMDGIKNWAHKDVITRTFGMTPCLVTLQWFCQQHTLTLFFHFASQCRATNQKQCLSGAYMTNKAICHFTGCPPLTESFPQALDRQRHRCWYNKWNLIILGNVCVFPDNHTVATVFFFTSLYFSVATVVCVHHENSR